MAPSRKYNLNQKMYAEGDIYLGDHLTRSWTRDERGGPKQPASPVLSEPDKPPSNAASMYQMRHSGHASLSRTRSSLREPRGSRKNWVSKVGLQNVTPNELHEWKESFDKLLQSPVGSKLFRVFLESEIAEENLLFWEACEELKQMKKEKRVRKQMQNIFDDFISVYSPREINIDYKMREDIVEKLNNSVSPDPDVFREAQMQIYHLMHRDSYPRFLASAVTAHQIEEDRSTQKGSKRQYQEYEPRRKVNTKSRILCCYGADDDDEETQEKFVTMEEQHIVEETPHSPVNGQGFIDATAHKRLDSTAESVEKESKPESAVEATVTQLSDTVTSQTNETVHADVVPPNVADVTRKLSDPADKSSKRESGIELLSCSTHCEEDVINDIITTIEKSENDVTDENDEDVTRAHSTRSSLKGTSTGDVINPDDVIHSDVSQSSTTEDTLEGDPMINNNNVATSNNGPKQARIDDVIQSDVTQDCVTEISMPNTPSA